MKRRQFLKSVFGVVAGVVVVPSVVKAKPKPKLWFRTEAEVAEARKTKRCKDCYRECRHYLKCQQYDVPLSTRPEDGLKEAFCYGGKLFRVFPGYFDEDFTMIQLRESKLELNYMLTNEEYNNYNDRNLTCEYMLCRMKYAQFNNRIMG